MMRNIPYFAFFQFVKLFRLLLHSRSISLHLQNFWQSSEKSGFLTNLLFSSSARLLAMDLFEGKTVLESRSGNGIS